MAVKKSTAKSAARSKKTVQSPSKKLSAKSAKVLTKNNKVAKKPKQTESTKPSKGAKTASAKNTKQLKGNKKIASVAKTSKPATTKPAVAPVMVKAPSNQNRPVMASAAPAVTSATLKAAISPMAGRTSNSPFSGRTSVTLGGSAPRTPFSGKPIVMPTEPLKMKYDYKVGDHVVYPAHGVGQIDAIETQTIAGLSISVYAITFEKDRMRLKVPVMKAESSGLRKISSTDRFREALKTLKGRAKIRRVMWSRRAQEYETKINSGDPVAIAEVLRDLKRGTSDTDQSYSERQIYQSAIERLARELAVVNKISQDQATKQIEQSMGVKAGKTQAV